MGDDSDKDDAVLDSICEAEGWYKSGATEDERIATRDKVKTSVKGIITDFIRYHIQDQSIALAMAMDPNAFPMYESMKRDKETGRFIPLTVVTSPTEMTVTDKMGNVRKINKTSGLYNNLCREYWFDSSGRLIMNSDVVVHLIDEPLYYENLKPWRKVVRIDLGLEKE